MQVILNENQNRDISMQGENQYTLGFRLVVAKDGRKKVECQELGVRLSNRSGEILFTLNYSLEMI